MRPHDDRREQHRHRHRGGHCLGHAVARQIAAQDREQGRKERERHPVIQIGRVDADLGPLPAKDVGKRRALENLPLEPVAEMLAGVEAAAEHAHQVLRAEKGQPHAALEIGQQNVLAKARQAVAAVHTVMRRGEGASGNAADRCHVVEQVAVGRLRVLERGENAVGESRGAQPAAGERQHDRVLAHEVHGRAHVGRRGGRQRRVRRRIEHRCGAAREHRQDDKKDRGPCVR